MLKLIVPFARLVDNQEFELIYNINAKKKFILII